MVVAGTSFNEDLTAQLSFTGTGNSTKKASDHRDTTMWLGNDYFFQMTNNPKNCQLRIDMEYYDGGWKKFYAKYKMFSVGNEQSKYTLHVSGYSGNSGNSFLGRQNGMKFSTCDEDNDIWKDCAATFKGGWWYDKCHAANLNERYYDYNDPYPYASSIHWRSFDQYKKSMAVVEIKVKAKR